MEELSGVIVFKHNSIRINKGKVIYIGGNSYELEPLPVYKHT